MCGPIYGSWDLEEFRAQAVGLKRIPGPLGAHQGVESKLKALKNFINGYRGKAGEDQ